MTTIQIVNITISTAALLLSITAWIYTSLKTRAHRKELKKIWTQKDISEKKND